MNTYTHFLMTAFANERLKKNDHDTNTAGLLIGSFLPDVPLTVFTLGYFAYRAWIEPLPEGEFIFDAVYDAMYFENPFMIFGHSLFHSPIMIGLWALLGYTLYRSGRKKWGAFLQWLAAGTLFHSLVDIVTHHNDGPLLFYPFDWQTRLITPISYWDPNHYGHIIAPLEHIMVLILLGYFIVRWFRRQNFFNRPDGQIPAGAE